MTGDADARREGKADAELVAPFRIGSAALVPEEACAIKFGVSQRIDDQLVEIGSDKAEVKVAHAADLTGIGSIDVDTAGRHAADVGIGVGDEAVVAQEQRARGGSAIDPRAEERITGGDALIDDRVETDCPDRVPHPDVEPIDGHRKARDEAWLEDDTDRIGVGRFG